MSLRSRSSTGPNRTKIRIAAQREGCQAATAAIGAAANDNAKVIGGICVAEAGFEVPTTSEVAEPHVDAFI
ncbi:hypothetical protein AU467_02200 [Mesorhizobium loti]|uniref:Uncharacterized protein n=1 Tax=Rhizobium loti TaxID=381 RepID=A0A117N3Y2_RHILI|nr:hypothetical protein AU467_02200 [Mesorhizobium loti]